MSGRAATTIRQNLSWFYSQSHKVRFFGICDAASSFGASSFLRNRGFHLGCEEEEWGLHRHGRRHWAVFERGVQGLAVDGTTIETQTWMGAFFTLHLRVTEET